jgi:hypothetical protein
MAKKDIEEVIIVNVMKKMMFASWNGLVIYERVYIYDLHLRLHTKIQDCFWIKERMNLNSKSTFTFIQKNVSAFTSHENASLAALKCNKKFTTFLS